jgi:hypothetical protein
MRTMSEIIPLEFNMYKSIKTKNPPFDTIVYISNHGETFFVENPRIGKSVITDSYSIQKLFHMKGIVTGWLRTFDNQYVKIKDDMIFHFMPLFYEQFRKPVLTFDLCARNLPIFRTANKYIGDNINNVYVTCVDNEIDQNKPEETTYNYLFKNVQPIITDNFKLEFVEENRPSIYNDDGTVPIPHIKITCSVPIFQPYSILYYTDNNKEEHMHGYGCDLIVMKIDNDFYRFPYGNMFLNDKMCFGDVSRMVPKEPPSIAEAVYSHIITSRFNGDFSPAIQFDNTAQISLDIDHIREKISQNDFKISFIDTLLYLSSCEDPSNINFNIFLKSPNVPKFSRNEES